MRTIPRPKIALCITSAMIIPSVSSSATEITVTKGRVEDVLPPQARGQDGLVVVQADEAAFVGEAQVELL